MTGTVIDQPPAPGRAGLGRGIVPLAIAGLAAAAEFAGDTGRLALRFDQTDLAAGELWRLVTGHLVHLGPSHLVMNLLALAILTYVLPSLARPVDWLFAGLAAALAIDVGLLVFHPAVDWYVGLSGVLHGFWAAGVVLALGERRFDSVPLALLLLFKLGFEAVFGPVPFSGEVAAGSVVTPAHAWGAAGGVLSALALLAIRHRRPSL